MIARCLWLISFTFTLGMAGVVLAQAAWPEYPTAPGTNPNLVHAIERGPGGYLAWWKLLILVASFWAWVKTTDWVNRDCQWLGLPYSIWNVVVFAPFLVGLVLAVTIPLFAAGMAVLVLTYLVPNLIYVVNRNKVVEPYERVLTPAHIRFVLAHSLRQFGIKMAAEKQAAHERGAPVDFQALGGSDQQNKTNLIAARQSPGYLPAKDLIADAIRQRADKVMLDYTPESIAVRLEVDGVWLESEPQERETGELTLGVFKKLSNLNVAERRKRQDGKFSATLNKVQYITHILSQGTENGERVVLHLHRPQVQFQKLTELGMREKMQQQLLDILSRDRGLVLFSALPAGGLSTTVSVTLKMCDRYMRDFAALQNVEHTEPLAENIELVTYDLKKGDSPLKILSTLLRKEPNVVVVHDLIDAPITQLLCEQAAEDKVVIATVRAKEAVEALLRVLLLKVPPAKFAPAVIAVVNQRLVRLLCDGCKHPFEPSAELLKKLGIPPGRIQHLFRPPEESEREKPCPVCNGIGYRERTSIFELLVIDDRLRQALLKQPQLDVLRNLARQSGSRTLQEEGIVLVARGLTSLNELSRVLKG